MHPLDVLPPSDKEMSKELSQLRRFGIIKLSSDGSFPALEQAARAGGRVDQGETVGPFVVERMLRDAVAQIGGDLGDAAELVFGLAEGARADKPSRLREEAADILHVSLERFRHSHEKTIITHVASLVLSDIHDYRLQLMRVRDQVRSPAETRLAVEWLERFQGMYAIWQPLTGVGANLTAYRSTLLEESRPYDRKADPDDPDDDGYSQEIQAAGYITDAYVNYAQYLVAEADFDRRFGSHWLTPEAGKETDLTGSLLRIRNSSPQNAKDHSYLRRLLRTDPDREMITFLDKVKLDAIAMEIHDEWQDWSGHCQCKWKLGDRTGRELFPTSANNPEISPRCPVHILISACNDYCLVLDDQWDQIADWYHDAPFEKRRDLSAEEIHHHSDCAR